MEQARMGEPLPHEAVVRIARLFKDELTLANMPRPQLVTMCQFMNLQPFGSDTFLRFQLRTKLNSIKEDDKRIVWEGVDSLSAQELKDACRERGMHATGLNTFGYRKQLKEWLDLSMLKHTPISLLIMSRAFVLNLSKENRQLRYEESLQTSISSMDEDVVNEVIVQR
jgi:LETM1 and EF-hand domain-containing protein 1